MSGGKESRYTDVLGYLGENIYKQAGARDNLKGAMNLLQSLITTGGTQPRTGIIGQSVERSGRAASRARETTEENLARTDQAGTPFGNRMMGEFDLNAMLELAGIVTQLQEQDYWGHMQLLLPFLAEMIGVSAQALGTAGSVETSEVTGEQLMPSLLSGWGQFQSGAADLLSSFRGVKGT